VTLAGATLEGEVMGEEEPTTFLTMDFFEHDTQATPVVAGLTPFYDMAIQYVVKVCRQPTLSFILASVSNADHDTKRVNKSLYDIFNNFFNNKSCDCPTLMMPRTCCRM
jgi:hypothetical protein